MASKLVIFIAVLFAAQCSQASLLSAIGSTGTGVISSVAGSVGNSAAAAVVSNVAGVVSNSTAATQAVVSNVTGAVSNSTAAVVSNVAGAVSNSTAATQAVVSNVTGAVSNSTASLKDAFQQSIAKASQDLSNFKANLAAFINATVEQVNNATAELEQTIAEVAQNLKSAISDAVEKVKSDVDEAIARGVNVTNCLSSVGNDVSSIVNTYVSNFQTCATSAISPVVNTASDLVGLKLKSLQADGEATLGIAECVANLDLSCFLTTVQNYTSTETDIASSMTADLINLAPQTLSAKLGVVSCGASLVDTAGDEIADIGNDALQCL